VYVYQADVTSINLALQELVDRIDVRFGLRGPIYTRHTKQLRPCVSWTNGGGNTWRNAVTDTLLIHAPVPVDWQAGPLTLRLSRNGGPTPGTAVMTVEVRRYRAGRTYVTLLPSTRSDITITSQEQKTLDVDIPVEGNFTNGDWLLYFVQRLGLHAEDTLSHTIGFVGAVIEYVGVRV
jgi:hypothetical protein